MSGKEQLMNILLAPHVTEKTSLAMQNHNQYAFRVRRTATKPQSSAAATHKPRVREPGQTNASGHPASNEATPVAHQPNWR